MAPINTGVTGTVRGLAVLLRTLPEIDGVCARIADASFRPAGHA